MALLILGAAYMAVLIVRRQTLLSSVSRYNLTWLVSQAGLEVSRLNEVIAASLIPGSGIDDDEVDLRLSIVENRIQLIESGDIAHFIATSPDLGKIVGMFRKTIHAARAELDHHSDPGRSLRLLRLIGTLNTPIAHLAAAANAYSGNLEAQDKHDLNTLHWLFAAILATITACGLSLVAALTWHNRLLARAQDAAHRQNLTLQERDVELHTRNRQFDAALNNMSQALCMMTADGQISVRNTRFLELFRLDEADARLGSKATDVFASIAEKGPYHPTLIQSIAAKQVRHENERCSVISTKTDEAGRALTVSQVPMADGGWVSTFEDVSERLRTEARIRHMAHHDSLTDLPNRALFQARLEEALERHKVTDTGVTLFCLDLDQFKQVNDVYGHPFGDMLLKVVGERLKGCLREGDTIARLGGDEFAILQVGVKQQSVAEATATRAIQTLSSPYEIEGNQVVIGVSVGVAQVHEVLGDANVLLKSADIALYRAKLEGRGMIRFYESTMGHEVRKRRQIEDELRDACARNEIKLFYQPLYNIDQGKVSGFEALLRWEHPRDGMISPATFVPIAEETGLITAIGEWVLEQACMDAAAWPADLKVAVNLSPVQFRSSNLVAAVQQALLRSGLAPNRLELEVTESTLLQNSDSVLDILKRLRALGPHLALDDFGTGYSSLSYLHAFPFSKVKIDQSFVHGITTRPHCNSIVQAVTSLAKALGMTTTAEGVETDEQLELLRQARCTEAQGFLFDRPQPVTKIARWFPKLPATDHGTMTELG